MIARTSEEGVREVGEVALDAARQARRAAEAAERSAKAAAAARPRAVAAAGPIARDRVEQSAIAPGAAQETAPTGPHFEVRFRRFNERADRVSARLRVLQGHPDRIAGPTVAGGRRRGDG